MLNYLAGSAVPTNSDLTNVMNATLGNLVPNDLEVILTALRRKSGWEGYPPATQPAINTLLP